MLNKIGCILLLFFSFHSWAAVESMVDISIVKSKQGYWTVTYKTHKPASRLSFIRNPDASRIERWQPNDSSFEIVSIADQEFIIKQDGSYFTQVSLLLTPTYQHLAKDYAPFSPYSDGGVLLYTGRLFACIEYCLDEINQWQFALQVPAGEHIVLNGTVQQGDASWIDNDDGRNVYVGPQKPLETENVIAVIDKGLPDRIKHSLDADIPKLMEYYEQGLGKLTGIKPTLFASYANVAGHSSQGGTLPSQIFMHWDQNNLSSKVSDKTFLNNTIWFFAHEVAHLYQGDFYGDRDESWLHEGHADWLAARALLALYPETEGYVTHKIDRFRTHCATGLTHFPLVEAADKGRFDLYYTCGLLIHQAIDLALQQQGGNDIYDLWTAFRIQADQGDKKASDLFLSMTEKWTSPLLVARIKAILNSKLSNPEQSLTLVISGDF